MPRQRAKVKANQFIGGFITESNPLAFPENTSSDEQNLDIKEDGSRKRRLGFDVEDNYTALDTGIALQTGVQLGRSQFRWTNAGNNPNKKLLVIQIGNYLAIHDLDSFPLSGSKIYSKVFDVDTYSTNYSYAVVDGVLVVANGEKEITVFEYDNGVVTSSTKILYVRDTFGVYAEDGNGDVLTNIDYVAKRPFNITSKHLYNLRNQTFGQQVMTGQGDSTLEIDPAAAFKVLGNVWPSNADTVTRHLLANPAFTSDRTAERFNPISALAAKPEAAFAPRGHFVIDALSRGTSRLVQENIMRSNNPTFINKVHNLPKDQTPGGPSVLEQYAGRIWYAGFSGEVNDGDDRSPRMTSYVLFSQLVNDPTQINRCYQEADPTSAVDPDLVATDGGFIKVDGAYNIRALKAVQSSLFVLDNGVWQISGIDKNTFTATSYSVDKISTEGCISGTSVVNTSDSLFYWSHESINSIRRNEFGDWVVDDITENTIRSFYADIPLSDKKGSVGYYDPSLSITRWIYGNTVAGKSVTNELVLNLKYPSFTKNLINSSDDLQGPISVSGGESVNSSVTVGVTVEGVDVTVNGELVTVNLFVEQISADESFYCILLDLSPTITYTFGGYIRENWLDWDTFTGVDSPAFLISAPQTAGEGRRLKDVPYLTTYFNYNTPLNGLNTSSCLVSSRWDWTTSASTGKWSTPRQAFRITREQTGETLVSTRNKVRGMGKAISFKFESEAGKDLHIYGYDHNLDVNEEE